MQSKQQLNPESPVKEYTGVWIPAEVMESEDLSPMEKLLYGEIAGFRQCYASNAWLAGRIDRDERTVRRLISHMTELGFIENCGFNGRFRLIRVSLPCRQCPVREDKNVRPDRTKMSAIIKKSNNVDNKLSTEETGHGNENINELFDYWRDRVGIEPTNDKMNRNSCHTLIRQRGIDGAKQIVDIIAKAIQSQDEFAPTCSSFKDLYGRYGKLSRLEAWNIKKAQKTAPNRLKVANTDDSSMDYEPSDEERAETLKKMKEARQRLFGGKK